MARTPEREQFLADIICTAVEGGTNYWAAVTAYKWADRPAKRTYAILVEEDFQDEGEPYDYCVTIETIAYGISRIMSGEVLVRRDIFTFIAEGREEDDAGMIDADAADAIVQAALFGQLVYG